MREKPAGFQFVLLAKAGTPAKSRDVRNSMDASNRRGQHQKGYIMDAINSSHVAQLWDAIN
jgi:hypothetical protein